VNKYIINKFFNVDRFKKLHKITKIIKKIFFLGLLIKIKILLKPINIIF